MRLPGALPLSFFALSLSAALPVRSLLQLTPDNFDKTVSDGFWFIEHFSPYCHHCKEFMPTWEKLVDKVEESPDLKHVRLAQVNCAQYGDLCDAHKVRGYPQINLYDKGTYLKQFKGSRELERLTEFLATNAPKPVSSQPEPVKAPAKEEVKKIASPPPPPQPKLNLDGKLLTLDPSNYQSTLNQGPIFVKFYAPWCGHCKKLAPTWVQLARHMQNKMNVAEVNCEAHSSLCSKEKIEGYPTLIFFNNGIRKDYNGGRKIDQLKDFAEKASSPPLEQIEASQVSDRLNKNEVAFLLLQKAHNDHVFQSVKSASAALLGTAPVYAVTSPELLVEYGFSSVPYAILSIKSNSLSASTVSIDNLQSWFTAHSLPTALELSQETFQSVMNAQHRPLVVIAAVTPANKARVSAKLLEIGKLWLVRNKDQTVNRSNEVVFAWMDAERWDKWIKSMYGITDVKGDTADPPIVISNHQSLVYYDQDVNGKPIQLSSTRLFETVEAALSNQLSAKHSENFIERFARIVSANLVAAETYVLNNPLHAILFVLGGGAVLFWLLKKWLSTEDLDPEHGPHRKSARLD